MKLMRNMGSDKEYVSVCPRVVVNMPGSREEIVGTHQEARGTCMQKTMERPEELLSPCARAEAVSLQGHRGPYVVRTPLGHIPACWGSCIGFKEPAGSDCSQCLTLQCKLCSFSARFYA